MRASLEFMLGCEGYEVLSFASAHSFWAGDVPSRPGCLILDVCMPELSGLELQEEINRRSYQTPIIFLTAHGEIDMAVHAMREGACDFQQKPIRADRLLQSVARAVEIDRQRRGGAKDLKDEVLKFQSLSEREEQICREVAKGYINKVIAERLGISKRTVDHHRRSALTKLDIHSIAQLAAFFERIDEFHLH